MIDAIDQSIDRRCFNEAAAFQPRKASGTGSVRVAVRSFNGAAAFQPRKADLCRPAAPARTGFNGAAAFQPRKGGDSSLCIGIAARLQWGRGSSAAESQFAIIILTKFIHASMGPRRFSRGKDKYRKYKAILTLASMGPRRFSRGKDKYRKYKAILTLASMGPRRFSRGKRDLPTVYPHMPLGFNWAAALQPRKATESQRFVPVGLVLQWGRGFSAAESQFVLCSFQIISPLQWGRGFSAVESQFAIIILTKFIHASMGPRLFSRGKRSGGRIMHKKSLSFNGAAAFQPRKAEWWADHA